MKAVPTAAVLALAAVLGLGVRGTAARPGREIPMINRATPILHVERVEPSVKFFAERLGFKKSIEVPEGDHLGFVAMEAGPVELMFQTYEGMRADPANPLAKAAAQGPSFLFVEVPDIQATISAMRGATIVVPLHDTPYGAKEIVVREPGGHYVILAQVSAHAPA